MEKTSTLENIAGKAKSGMAVGAGLLTNIAVGAGMYHAQKAGVSVEESSLLAIPGIGAGAAITEYAFQREGAKKSKGALIGAAVVAPVGQAIGYGLAMISDKGML